jgi:phosphoribosyl 1,2-cyclic phosphodiesterase
LASSSDGNAFVLSFDLGGGSNASLLVEAGLQYSALKRKCAENGLLLSGVSAVLATHSHGDHSRSLKTLSEKGFKVMATKGTLEACGCVGRVLEYGKPTEIEKGLAVVPFPVMHDAPEPAGFIFITAKECAIFAIDSGEWLADLSAFRPDYVFCEADYDGRLMEAEQFSLRGKAGKSNFQRYRQNARTIKQHMSLGKAINTVSRLDLSKCKTVFLTHLSDHLASPNAFKIKASAMLGVKVAVCLKDGGML